MPFTLPTADEKADYVYRQFERIAKRYDLTNDAISMGMHRLWKARAIDLMELRGDGSYLDVCCGTGDLALMIARRLPATGSVTGLDFSESMLSVAQERGRKGVAEQAVQCSLEWKQGDAQNLPFPDNSFDGAIISFGLRNLTDLQRGLCEMARVVRPGGKVINLDLGHSNVPLFAPTFRLYFRHVVPMIGAVLQKDRKAYTYLPESLNTYPKPDKLSEMFEQAGLKDVRYEGLALGSVALHIGTVR